MFRRLGRAMLRRDCLVCSAHVVGACLCVLQAYLRPEVKEGWEDRGRSWKCVEVVDGGPSAQHCRN